MDILFKHVIYLTYKPYRSISKAGIRLKGIRHLTVTKVNVSNNISSDDSLFNISSSTQGPNAGILRSLTESMFICASKHCILITSYHSEYVLIKDNTGS